MKRLSMNNEELMWKLSQSDVGPLDVDDGAGERATTSTSREAAGGMFMSATLPSRGSRGSSGPRAMSRSYDSPRAMFGPSSGVRQRGAKSTTEQRPHSATVPAKTDSDNTSSSSPASALDSANSRLRRSGTYDVVDDK